MTAADRRAELRPSREPDTEKAQVGHARGPAEAMLRLQHTVGNRSVARLVARRPLARSPSASSWASQTTVANQALATEIDELEKLDDQELSRRREEMLSKASIRDDAKHGQYERSLEAIEFLAARRGIKPVVIEGDYRLSSDRSTARRRTVRLATEAGIRETGSLDKSIEGLTNAPKEWEAEFDFLRKEADEFGKDFTRQAREIGVKMLEESEREIYRVVESYGLRHEIAGVTAELIVRDSDRLDDEVQKIVGAAGNDDVWLPEREVHTKHGTRYDPWVTHRRDLADAVARLKQEQQVVNQRQQELEGATAVIVDDPYDAEKGARYDIALKRHQLAADHLDVMWARAEREHPVLAAYRGGKTQLEGVDLGDLDAASARPQMTAMLKQVLPKLAAILETKGRLKANVLSPLSLPPVVALTKAVMFVPEGSIRAGKVGDLVAAAQDTSVLKYIGLGLLALIALAAALPTGGESLGIGITIISAALSTASAVEDWEHYQQQKTLANTALDRAKALSAEEPSLLPFALDLVFLGLDAAPLASAFREGIALRNLVRAGDEAKNAKQIRSVVDELNDLGKAKGEADLGEKALADARAAEREAAAARQGAQPALRPPPHSDYETVDELRTAVRAHIKNTLEQPGANEEWTELWADVDRAKLLKDHPGDQQLMGLIDRVHSAVRDPSMLEDAMAELWTSAARDGITEQEALVRWAGGEPLPRVFGQDAARFQAALLEDKPLVDEFFRDTAHGAYTHVFQEYVVARALGGKEAAREFRHAIANAAGPAQGRTQFFSRVWDAVFDSYDGTQINSPEGIGPILKTHLNLE